MVVRPGLSTSAKNAGWMPFTGGRIRGRRRGRTEEGEEGEAVEGEEGEAVEGEEGEPKEGREERE